VSEPSLHPGADAQRRADAAFGRAVQARRAAVGAFKAAERARGRADAARNRLVQMALDPNPH
jgi:hypothetical protein